MATTSDGIFSPDRVSKWALVNDLKAMADSIQRVFDNRTGAGFAERASQIAVPSSADFSQSPLATATAMGNISFTSNGFTVKRAGWFQINAQTVFTSNPNGGRAVAIGINGDDAYGSIIHGFEGHSNWATVNVVRPLKAGDVVSVMRWQNSGVTLFENEAHLSIAQIA